VQLLKAFTACRLESTSHDLEAWFVELDRINDKLASVGAQYEKKDYKMKSHLLGNLPLGHEDVETKLQGQEDKMAVKEIEEEISNKWQRKFSKDQNASKKSKGNVALSAKSTGRKFKSKYKGRYRKCGKMGHKYTECKVEGVGICYTRTRHSRQQQAPECLLEQGNTARRQLARRTVTYWIWEQAHTWCSATRAYTMLPPVTNPSELLAEKKCKRHLRAICH
jgi:hypothetical protein